MRALPWPALAALCVLMAGCVAAAQGNQRSFIPVVYGSAGEGATISLPVGSLALGPADVRSVTGAAAYQDLGQSGPLDGLAVGAECGGLTDERAQLSSLGPADGFRSTLRSDATSSALQATHVV